MSPDLKNWNQISHLAHFWKTTTAELFVEQRAKRRSDRICTFFQQTTCYIVWSTGFNGNQKYYWNNRTTVTIREPYIRESSICFTICFSFQRGWGLGVYSSFRLRKGKPNFLSQDHPPDKKWPPSPIKLIVSTKRCLEHYLNKVVIKWVLLPYMFSLLLHGRT